MQNCQIGVFSYKEEKGKQLEINQGKELELSSSLYMLYVTIFASAVALQEGCEQQKITAPISIDHYAHIP